MRGLEVQLNGKKICSAGIEQDAVLNAIVNVIGRPEAGYDMHIRVGGMEHNVKDSIGNDPALNTEGSVIYGSERYR